MKRFFDVFLFVQGKICAVLLFAMIAVTTFQIIARSFLYLSTPWTEEIARVFLTWITFMGGTGMLIKGEHLTVDFLSSMFTPSMRKIARVFNNIVYGFFSCFMLVFGFRLITNPIIARSLMPAMQISRNWQYAVMPFCMIFMFGYSVYALTLSVKELFHKSAAQEKALCNTGGNE